MGADDLRETERLEALRALDLLDSVPDAELDQVVGLAAGLFNVPVALLTITAEARNWFKARFGTELCESPRDISFCTWAIQGDGLFEIPDCTADPRFADNPLVTGPLHVRYYAGMPIRIDGHAIGTLCLMDFVPRPALDAVRRQRLGSLVDLTVTIIEARKLRQMIARDLAVRKALEIERAEAQRFADHVCENLPATLFVKDAATRRYLLFNKAGEELTGIPSADIVGRTDGELWPDEAGGYTERDTRVVTTGVAETYESEVVRPDGETRIMRTRRVLAHDDAGRPTYILGIGEDVTDWRRAQQQLAFAAGHDALTGLYNRDHFLRSLDDILTEQCSHDRQGGEAALLALDLDRFSSIVDVYGRTVSDELLVDVAARVRLTLKPGACAARFDADRFFVALAGAGAGRRAETLAHELLAGIATRDGDGGAPQARGRIGIAVAPRDGVDAETLVASAELAALRAKSVPPSPAKGSDASGDTGWRIAFFERAQDEAAKRRRRIQERLAHAIEEDRIEVHYQPVIALDGGSLAGFEALARWRDGELGDVSPVEFIPIAEASGMISRLGAGVLAKAARAAAIWTGDLVLSVNFSAAQFADDGLADAVAAALAAAGLDPRRLEVEITESLLIAPHERVLGTLRRLKAMGATIAMDDFGTGYSSLSYFCSFPFDKVKIDQSFVRDMTTSREARAIVRAVVGLAHGIGMKVTGEGVETQDQFDALAAEGCDLAQGFLIGRPAAAPTYAAATRMQASKLRRAGTG